MLISSQLSGPAGEEGGVFREENTRGFEYCSLSIFFKQWIVST